MPRCKFCTRRFESAQAVRGHLRACEVYRSGQPKAQPNRLAQPIGSAPKPGGVAEGVLDELQSERARLDLRKIQAEHKRLDAEEIETARAAEKESARARQNELEAAAQARRQTRRRAILERVKARSVYAPAAEIRASYPVITATEEGQALEEIEKRLSVLDVETIPEDELIRIAVGIRNGIYSRAIQAANREAVAATIEMFKVGVEAAKQRNSLLWDVAAKVIEARGPK